MTDDEIEQLVSKHIESETKEVEHLKKAIKYVSERLSLAKDVCNEVFGPEEASSAKNVCAINELLTRETSVQAFLALGKQRSSLGPSLGPLPPRGGGDGEFN